jgi:hypothetical protein
MQQQLLFEQQKAKRDRRKAEEAIAAAKAEARAAAATPSPKRAPHTDLPQRKRPTALAPEWRPPNDSGLHSEQSLDKRGGGGEIYDPSVKELLVTCAKYNLDQTSGPPARESAEVLEEISRAEAALNSRSPHGKVSPAHSSPASQSGGGGGGAHSKSLSVPQSPLGSVHSARPPDSSSAASPQRQAANGTPSAGRRALDPAECSRPTAVSLSSTGKPVTSIVVTPPPYSPEEASKKSKKTAGKRSEKVREASPGSDTLRREHEQRQAAAIQHIIDTSTAMQRRVPVLPVLVFVTVYILAGAFLFSFLEKDWTFLVGAYFSFITLTTIGFGDYVPGDQVLSSENGQGMLVLVCVYVLMGLAVVAMSINLVQEEIMNKFRELAKDLGIIDREEEEDIYGGGPS